MLLGKSTTPKFNMEPENDGFQNESPFPGTSFIFFSGSMLNFRGVWNSTPVNLQFSPVRIDSPFEKRQQENYGFAQEKA